MEELDRIVRLLPEDFGFKLLLLAAAVGILAAYNAFYQWRLKRTLENQGGVLPEERFANGFGPVDAPAVGVGAFLLWALWQVLELLTQAVVDAYALPWWTLMSLMAAVLFAWATYRWWKHQNEPPPEPWASPLAGDVPTIGT